MANVDTDRGTREKIRFIDTEGLGGGNGSDVIEVPRHLHSVADGFIIVYAVDDERSFQVAEALKRDIEKNKEKKEVIFCGFRQISIKLLVYFLGEMFCRNGA